MTNLAAVQTTEAACLTNREGREVVVEDEALAVLATGVVVKILTLVGRSQGRGSQCLGFTPCKESRTVHPWEKSHFTVELTKIPWRPAIGTDTFFHDAQAEGLLLNVFEDLLDLEAGRVGSAFLDRCLHFVAEGTNLLGALDLAGRVDSVLDPVACDLVTDGKQIVLGHRHGVVTLFLAGQLDQLFLGLDQLGHGLLASLESFDKLVFGNFVARTFNHDHVGLVTNVNQVEVASFALLKGRVDDKLAVDPANTHSTDRSCKRDVGNREGRRSTVHGQNVRVVDCIRTQHERDDLRVIKVTFREQRTQWAVRHPAGENLFFGRTSFTLEVAAGERSSR